MVFHVSIWGGLELCLGGLAPRIPPVATGLGGIQSSSCPGNHQTHLHAPGCYEYRSDV